MISLGLKLAAIMAAKKAALYGVAWVSFHFVDYVCRVVCHYVDYTWTRVGL